MPYLPLKLVEAAVERHWVERQLSTDDLAAVRAEVFGALDSLTAMAVEERERLGQLVHTIKRERLKWAEKAMDGTVPDDIARDRQSLLAGQLAAPRS